MITVLERQPLFSPQSLPDGLHPVLARVYPTFPIRPSFLMEAISVSC